jgi:ABC-type multidrug transport system fused ATPase/permease subunit
MMRLIRELIRPHRGTLAIILIAMFIETLMGLAAPWPIKVILDNVVASHHLPPFLQPLLDSSFGATLGHGKLEIAAFAALATVLIAVIGSLASYVDSYYTESVGQWVAHSLRMRTYEHLQRLSLSYYDSHQTGALLSTITNDIQTIQNFASSSTLGIVVDLFTILEMLGLMFWLNWDFALVAVGITPFLLFFMSRFKGAVKKATRNVRLRQADIVSVVQEGLESERVVKAFGREDLEEEKLARTSRATVDAALKARQVKALVSPIVSVSVALCTGFVLWRGAGLILRGTMTAGALTVFLAYLTKFFKPVQDLAKMTNTIAQAAVGVERVQAILETDTIIPEHPNAQEPLPIRGEIIFNHVAFSYEKEAPILEDVNFTIKPGQLIGIVGPTGGGKSTVVSLIARFYDPTSGGVTLDGVDIREYKLRSLRDQIGFVLQDTVLFRGTIRENIAYGRPNATQEEIEQAAKLANADEFIAHMPLGYDSMVGERGLSLSGGQRQRIGIARAIIRNSPILILDEPTAALDTESERLVIEALERLMKGRTVITIAHRLSTIRDADSIIVLKRGVVAEQGTHQELLDLEGVYCELYRIQMGLASETVSASDHLPIHAGEVGAGPTAGHKNGTSVSPVAADSEPDLEAV